MAAGGGGVGGVCGDGVWGACMGAELLIEDGNSGDKRASRNCVGAKPLARTPLPGGSELLR